MTVLKSHYDYRIMKLLILYSIEDLFLSE